MAAGRGASSSAAQAGEQALTGERRSSTVVYEDEHLLVVDKPAGLVVHPAPGHRGPTLAQAPARPRGRRTTTRARPGIVHRLDRDTSGLLVVAQVRARPTRRCRRRCAAREVEREYLALVEGRPDADERHDRRARSGRDRAPAHGASPRAATARAPAVTHFEVIERLPAHHAAARRLETGRTHQIRAHLAAIGHPVCGDRQYGGRACGRRLGLTRQFLHAQKLDV